MKDYSLLKSIAICCLLFIGPTVSAQEGPVSKEKQIYNQLKAFSLTGGTVEVKGLALKRDRIQLTLDGVVYLSEPVEGMITGAVFVGEGKFVAQPPPNKFEQDNVKRLLGADLIEWLPNLNWLFSQFVYQTAFPSYEMEYKLQDQPGGKVIISGTVSQKNAPSEWIMVLPVKFSFGEKQFAVGTVLVQGEYSPFQIELPARPKKVELDPDRWILAEGISTRELK